jgi:23S rRNA (cytidine1920-2'-O)/16S rRNA (cytidine1409-2'-O)-methyltransferase
VNTQRKRLDVVLTERAAAQPSAARSLIMTGSVRVDGRVVDKPGALISVTSHVEVTGTDLPYVSRGGLKRRGVEPFRACVGWVVCWTSGLPQAASPTACFSGALHACTPSTSAMARSPWRLRQDPRVTVIERTNIRYMPAERIPSRCTSSPSTSRSSPQDRGPGRAEVPGTGRPPSALIKPQFEVGKGQVGKGGVVSGCGTAFKGHRRAGSVFPEVSARVLGSGPLPIEGPKGNKEFFMLECSFVKRK